MAATADRSSGSKYERGKFAVHQISLGCPSHTAQRARRHNVTATGRQVPDSGARRDLICSTALAGRARVETLTVKRGRNQHGSGRRQSSGNQGNEDLKAKMREALERKQSNDRGVPKDARSRRRHTAPRSPEEPARRCTGARPAAGVPEPLTRALGRATWKASGAASSSSLRHSRTNCSSVSISARSSRECSTPKMNALSPCRRLVTSSRSRSCVTNASWWSPRRDCTASSPSRTSSPACRRHR